MNLDAALREAWTLALAKPRKSGLRAAKFDGSGFGFWATANSQDRLGILVAVRAGEELAATIAAVDRASETLSAEIYPFEHDGRNLRGLHLWCQRADVHDAFTGFCVALLTRSRSGANIHQAFLESFQEFRSLVEGTSPPALPSSFTGLVGELAVLADLVTRGERAIDFWAFPEPERHDFRNGPAALEIKTTLRGRSGRPIVTISSFDQLEPPESGSLHLHWLRLERDTGGDISIAKLTERIVAQLSAERQNAFRTRIGTIAGIGERWHESFSIQERQTFCIAPGFPRLSASRLTRGSLDPGVAHVTYELDLSAAEAFRSKFIDAAAALFRNEESQ